MSSDYEQKLDNEQKRWGGIVAIIVVVFVAFIAIMITLFVCAIKKGILAFRRKQNIREDAYKDVQINIQASQT